MKVTKWLFVTSQIFALIWVSVSYIVAVYSTIFLQIPFPIETLSERAVETLLGVNALKVVENIFEHNESALFGTNIKEYVYEQGTDYSEIDEP